MTDQPYKCAEAAKALNVSPPTIHRMVRDYPGFGFQLRAGYRVPRAHVEALLLGEKIEDIAAKARAKASEINADPPQPRHADAERPSA